MEQQITEWIQQDPARREALQLAASLQLNDWCVAAGFVRNLVWDKIHGYQPSTPLNDIDLVYYDPHEVSAEADRKFEEALNLRSSENWSVKNQARMHHKHDDAPYVSTADAMTRWAELETAIGARLDDQGKICLVAPFGVARLLSGTITPNSRCNDRSAFGRRVINKKWLQTWPRLTVGI